MRTRYQTGGELYDEGDRWMFRYWEDCLDAAGQPVMVGGKPKRARKKQLLSKRNYPKKADALKEQARFMAEINREDYKPDSGITFGQFAYKWQAEVLIHKSPATQDQTKKEFRLYLLPRFENVHLWQITEEVVQSWINTLSKGVRWNVRGTGSTMWTKAVKWGYAKHNFWPELELPKKQKGNVYRFSAEEMLAIIHAAQGQDKLIFELLGHTGVRPEEFAGLRVEDLVGNVLLIRQTCWRGKVQSITKTEASVRKVPVHERIAGLLREHIESHPNQHGLIFANTQGRPIHTDHFNEMHLRPILRQLGIWERIKELGIRSGLYAFRHGNVTEQRRNGVPLKTVQARVGHAIGSDVTTTIYEHSVPADELAAANLMEAILGPKTEQERVQ